MPNEKTLALSLLLTSLLLLAGCDSGKKQIVGQWKSDAGSDAVVWEFFDDGRLSAGSQAGRYAFGDNERIKIQTQTATFVNQLKLEGDRMIWKAPDGSKQEFTRIK